MSIDLVPIHSPVLIIPRARQWGVLFVNTAGRGVPDRRMTWLVEPPFDPVAKDLPGLAEAWPEGLPEAEVLKHDGPVLYFGSDWSVRQSEPIHAGDRVLLVYDLYRLKQLGLTFPFKGHYRWWSIAGYVSAGPAQGAQWVSLIDYRPKESPWASFYRPNLLSISAPEGAGELAFWFFGKDGHSGFPGGKDQYDYWDSSFGRNFVFPVEG
jgi:hypothetical protein